MGLIALSFLRRHWAVLLAVTALLGAVWYLDHRGYQRAQKDAERRQLVDAIVAERKARRIEQAISEAVAGIDGRVGARIEAIRVIRQTINNSIEKEVRDDPRYSAPACALGDVMFDAINQARAASHPRPAAGQSGVYVPIAPSVE